VLFAGTVYTDAQQPEANRTLVDKLNRLGRLLANRNADLYVIGDGDLSRLDTGCVTWLGMHAQDRSWQYLQHADVGIVVAAGPVHHNNESTKIYHYLRAGLPVVSESGFPNDDVVREAGLGYVVGAGDLRAMADRVEEAVTRHWDREGAIHYILEHHTWDRRVAGYHDILMREFGSTKPARRAAISCP